MRLKIIALFLLFNFSIAQVRAASEDSLTINTVLPTVLRYIHSSIDPEGLEKFINQDTSLTDLSVVNRAAKKPTNSLGTLGSALKSQVFKVEKEIFPFIRFSAYQNYLWQEDSLRYYRTNKRFTQLEYHQSTFKEQEIDVIHSQNILKTWSAGINFHRLGVRDFIRNSDTYQNQLALYTWYESPNRRYNLFLSGIWNTIKNQLNGGLKYDSVFDQGNISNLGMKGLSVELTDAKHQFRNHSFSLQNRYNLISQPDSLSERKRKINSFQIIQTTDFESGSYAYSDAVNDSSFYDHFYQGSTSYDSLHYYNLKNSGGFLLPQSDSSSSIFFRHFTAIIEAEYQWFQYRQRDELNFDNYALKGKLFTVKTDSTFTFSSSLDYIFAGDNRGLYHFKVGAGSPVYKIGSLFAGFTLIRRQADMMYQHYYSNHFIWDNNFKEINTGTFNVGLKNLAHSFQLEYILHHIKNFVFIDADAIPEQNDGSLVISQIRLLKNFKAGIWHFDNEIYIQNSSNEKIIPLPGYAGIHSIYLEKDMFKKALRAQFGFRIRYNSAYYADAFMPATAMFYVQDQKKTGDYTMIDFFAHLKIKSAMIFLKVENIGDGIVAKNYYLTPEYPQAGRFIQFGLKWRFFDM